MTFTKASPIRGPVNKADIETAINYASALSNVKRQPEVLRYFGRMWKVCESFGFDFRLLVAQSAHETGGWSSDFWEVELNPAGIGKFDDGSSESLVYESGDESARAQGIHMWAYVEGKKPIPEPYDDDVDLDPRYDEAIRAFGGTVDVLGDLGSGKWATDPQYASKIAATANTAFPGGTSMATIVYGKVPHPTFKDLPITKPEGFGQNDLGRRSVKGVVWHRILGSLNGTSAYFRMPSTGALTDYGVGVAATDGAELAGVIYRWNNPLGKQSGWASGTYSSHAYGDGAAFVDKYGINAINRDQASIEISGDQTTPLDEKSRDAIAGLTAYWADQAKIPWDSFPTVPADGFSFVRWHEEFGPDNGTKKCPFDVVKAETPALIERTRALMKRYQVTASTPVEPKPSINWDVGETGVGDFKGTPVLMMMLEATIQRRTQPRVAANARAKSYGSALEKGSKIVIVGSFDSDWGVFDDGKGAFPRVYLPGMLPKIPKPRDAG